MDGGPRRELRDPRPLRRAWRRHDRHRRRLFGLGAGPQGRRIGSDDGRMAEGERRARPGAPCDQGRNGRGRPEARPHPRGGRSEEHTSELQSLMRISYAVFCLKKKKYVTETLKYIKHIFDINADSSQSTYYVKCANNQS